jgi:tRNA(adenine34) deaminase
VTERAGNHEEFMRRCIQLARHAKVQGNTAVGSVVVFDGKIVGEGVEQLPAGNILTGHAEVLACQQAIETLKVRRLEKATLYTTAEPCFMCSYVIRQCRIAKVVYGTETAMIGGVTSSFPILTTLGLNAWKPAPQVIGGVLAEECRRLHSR